MDSNNYIGQSEAFLDFQNKLSKAALVNRSILVIGERGSGKEIAASRLHYLSPRWEKPLITVNCAALTPSLIESELFGYEKGAFTGAQKLRKGRFEEADGGTIFLDEIGQIPLSVQTKILRVVEYGTFERIGSSTTQEVDVRIVGATNSDLPKLCKEGKFKKDLLDRLSFEVIFVPPLRTRGEDIMLLANFFASKMAMECNIKEEIEFSPEIIEKLNSYKWPGNVRELKNVIERAVYNSKEGFIDSINLDPFLSPYKEEIKKDKANFTTELNPISQKIEENLRKNDLTGLEEIKQSLDSMYLNSALKQSRNNQKKAAKLMSLTYDQFRGLYRKYKKTN